MIPIAICDDELLHARQTQAAIRRCEAQAVTRCFETPLALLAAVTQQGYAPRVAVLDIRMAGMDGIELAKRLNALVPGCAIIFLTAYLSYAPDVYETRHVYFVLKSELDRRIGSALRAALAETAAPASLQLATAHGYRNVPAPVFFGSALTNFGVEPFLEDFLKMTTPPLPRRSSAGEVDPFSPDFSAFVFKIQANMNKAHRDRVAFMRICSGKFEKGQEVFHVQGGKKIRLSQPQQMMAQEREIVEEAYAGDILGIFDPGIFSIGDTVCASGKSFAFEGIPTFAPEHFSLVRQTDTMKRKQFIKGTSQIAQEGAIQIFQELGGGMEEVIVGVVGTLQFDVLEYRLKNEYGVDIRMEGLPYQYIRWIGGEDVDVKALDLSSDTKRVQDMRGRPLLLFTNSWNIQWALDHNMGLVLEEFSRS